jgi:hypothetical protein
VQGLAAAKRQAATGGICAGRGSTAVLGVERAPNPVVSRACGTWNPNGVRAPPGKPTVRKAQVPSGNWMTREANAGAPKDDRKPGRVADPSVGRPA